MWLLWWGHACDTRIGRAGIGDPIPCSYTIVQEWVGLHQVSCDVLQCGVGRTYAQPSCDALLKVGWTVASLSYKGFALWV